MILELDDIQSFVAREIKDGDTDVLHISGLVFHSALAVEKITSHEEGASLVVLIFLAPAREGLSGMFEYDLSIPPSIAEVRFGNERAVIWER